MPLHLLLATKRGNNLLSDDQTSSSNWLRIIQQLVDNHPESVVTASSDQKKRPLDTVLEASNLPQVIMECICRSVPSRLRFFQLRPSPIMASLSHAKALSQLLPQLTVFECKRKEWHLDGWIHFLDSLACNDSIRTVTLVLPSKIPQRLYLKPLSRALDKNSSLTKLSLIYQNSSELSTGDNDFTEIVQTIFDHNVVDSLTLVGIHFQMKALSESLTYNNTSLMEWNLEGCTTLEVDRLVNVLLRHNATLQKVVLPPGTDNETKQKVFYGTLLNRFGRKQLHSPVDATSLDTVCSILGSLQNCQDYIVQQGVRIEMYQLRYGLLRESPSLWYKG